MAIAKIPRLYYAIKTGTDTYRLMTVVSQNPSTQSQLIFDFCQLCIEIKDTNHMNKLTYGDMENSITSELTEKHKINIAVEEIHGHKPTQRKFTIVNADQILLPIQ